MERRNSDKVREGMRKLHAFFEKHGDEIRRYERVMAALRSVDPKDVTDDFWGDEIIEECGQAVDDFGYIGIRVSRDKIVMEDYFRPRGSVEPVVQSRLIIEGIDDITELVCALNVDIDDKEEILGNLYDALVAYANENDVKSSRDFIPFLDSNNIEYEKN